MATRFPAPLVFAFVLAGCSDDVITTPDSRGTRVPNAQVAALITSFNLPVQFPTGLASNGGTLLYLSTGSGVRETHIINRVLQTDVGTIPTGGNPRDVTFDGTNLLFSDLSNRVDERTVAGTFLSSFPLPFRGGGIATDGDTIWAGDVDHNVMIVTANFGASYVTYPTAVRIEGLVLDPGSHTLWAVTPFIGDNRIYELTTYGALIRECESEYEPGLFGLGGIALVSDTFYIAEPQGGDPYAGTTILVFDKASLVCTPPLVQNVSLEIGQSHINVRSNAVIKIAILSDNGFDASTVNAASVRFGHNGSEAAAITSNLQDVDGDGDLDLFLRFKTRDTGIQCGDQSAKLTGTTMSGQPIGGSVAIQTHGCP